MIFFKLAKNVVVNTLPTDSGPLLAGPGGTVLVRIWSSWLTYGGLSGPRVGTGRRRVVLGGEVV